MKTKANDLSGVALDWAVSVAKGLSWKLHGHIPFSTDWSQSGALIEREKIEIFIEDERWQAYSIRSAPHNFDGDTPLIAAMRCYVSSQLGEEVDVPDELTQGEQQ